LTEASIRSLAGNRCQVRYAGQQIEFATQANNAYRLDPNLVLPPASK